MLFCRSASGRTPYLVLAQQPRKDLVPLLPPLVAELWRGRRVHPQLRVLFPVGGRHGFQEQRHLVGGNVLARAMVVPEDVEEEHPTRTNQSRACLFAQPDLVQRCHARLRVLLANEGRQVHDDAVGLASAT